MRGLHFCKMSLVLILLRKAAHTKDLTSGQALDFHMSLSKRSFSIAENKIYKKRLPNNLLSLSEENWTISSKPKRDSNLVTSLSWNSKKKKTENSMFEEDKE